VEPAYFVDARTRKSVSARSVYIARSAR
jgi:hypothetical protein